VLIHTTWAPPGKRRMSRPPEIRSKKRWLMVVARRVVPHSRS